MAEHTIKIKGTADFSGIDAEVRALHDSLQRNFEKSGIKLIDDESLASLRVGADQAFTRMSKQIEALKKEAKELDKAIKGSTGDEGKQNILIEKRLKNLKTIHALEKVKGTLKSTFKKHDGMPENIDLPTSQKYPLLKDTDSPTSRALVASEVGTPEISTRNPERISALQRLQPKPPSALKAIGGAAAGGALQVAHAIPGVSQVASIGSSAVNAGAGAMAAGMGGPATLALGALAAGASAAVVAIYRMIESFEVLKRGVPNMLAISGMGARPMREGRVVGEGGRLGFGQLEILETQKQMMHSLGMRNGEGQQISRHGDQNRMLNILTASRSLGMGPQQILQGADQLRQVGGTEVAQKQIGAILEKAITSGMDKSQAATFISSAVNLLTEINQNGTANTAAMLGAMTDVVSSGRMSPEQAAKTLGGMNSAVAGSTGENNAFFQTAAARSGLGGGTLMGTQFAVRQGLTGVDMDSLRKQVGDTESGRMGMKSIQEMGLGDSSFTQKFASNILSEVKGRFNTDSKEGRQASLGFVGQMFGAKTAPEAVKVMSLLEKLSKGAGMNKDDKQMLTDLGKDPEATWRDKTLADLDATARGVASMQAALEKAQFELGAASMGIIDKMNNALIKLDATIASFLGSDVFKKMEGALGTVGNSLKNAGGAIGDSISDVMKEFGKIPEALKGLSERLLGDPKAFGISMGKGFAEIVMTIWDVMIKSMKGLWELILTAVTSPGKVVDMIMHGSNSELGKVFDSTMKTLTESFGGVGKFLSGIGEGVNAGMEEHAKTGSVTYTDAQKKDLANLKTVASAPLIIPNAIQDLSDTTVNAGINSIRGMMAPSSTTNNDNSTTNNNKTNNTTNNTTNNAGAKPLDLSAMTEQQRKTNELLQKQLDQSRRTGIAQPPRTNRDGSR